MKKQETNFITHRDVPANPTLDFAEKMVARFSKKDKEGKRKFDEIISCGGGSTIDVCKYVATKLGLYHTAIPTTAGTGSEVTSYAVLTTNGKKITYKVDPPDEYALTPKHLESLDYMGRVSGVLDAYCHAIESLWSPKKTPQSTMYSYMAIDIIERYGKLFCHEGICGKDMLEASNYAGRAIEITATSKNHAMSYYLTEKHNIPHGIACGIMMKAQNIEEFDKLFLDLGIDYKNILEKVDIKALETRAKKSERYTNI